MQERGSFIPHQGRKENGNRFDYWRLWGPETVRGRGGPEHDAEIPRSGYDSTYHDRNWVTGGHVNYMGAQLTRDTGDGSVFDIYTTVAQ